MEEEMLGKIERLERENSQLKQTMKSQGLSSSSGLGKHWKRRLLVPLAVLSTLAVVGLAMAADIPHSFGTGGVISATKFNENFSYIVDRLWDKNGSDLYYDGGNVGIGTTDPAAELEVKTSAHPGATPLIRASAYSTGSAIDLIGLDMYSNRSSADYSVAQLVYGHGSAYVNPAFNILVADSSKVLQTRMTIDSTGDVGIGTTNPLTRLHVRDGDVIIDSAGLNQDSYLKIKAGAYTDYDDVAGIELYSGWGDSPYDSFRYIRSENTGGQGHGGSKAHLTFGKKKAGSLYEHMRIDTLGRVGIGTASPLAKLDVSGDTNDNSAAGLHVFNTDGTSGLYVRNDGNIGIGTASPGSRLVVVGNEDYNPLYINNAASTRATMIRFDNPSSTTGWWAGIGGDGVDVNFPSSKFNIVQDVQGLRFTIDTSGNVGIGTADPGSYKLYVAGNAYTTGTWGSSDARWKKNIDPLENSLDKVARLNGVNFEWDVDRYPEKGFEKGRQVGLIAQEVENVVPELVRTDEDGYKSVSYEKLSAVLIEAVKELKAENDALKILVCQDHPEAALCR